MQNNWIVESALFSFGDGTQLTLQSADGDQLTINVEQLLNEGGAWGIAYRGTIIQTEKPVFVKLGKIRRLDDNGKILSLDADRCEHDKQTVNEKFDIEYKNSLWLPPSTDEKGYRLVPVIAVNSISVRNQLIHWHKDIQHLRQGAQSDFHTFQIPYIVQDFVPGMTLEEYIKNLYKEGSLSESAKNFRETTFVTMALRLCYALRDLHRSGVIHNDFHPGNVMINNTNKSCRVYVLDFGYAQFRASADQSRMAKTEKAFVSNMFPNTVIGDIYSLGMVLLFTMTGVYPANHFEREDLRKQILKQLNDVKSDMLLQNPLLLDIIYKCIVPRLDSVFKSIDEVIEYLIMAFPDARDIQQKPAIEIDADAVGRVQQLEFSDIILNYNRLKLEPGNVFASVAKKCLIDAERLTDEMTEHCFDIYGNRNELLSVFLGTLAILKQDDAFQMMSTMSLWADNNFSDTGRAYTIVKQIVLRKVSFKHVFLIPIDKILSKNESGQQIRKRAIRILELHKKIQQLGKDLHQDVYSICVADVSGCELSNQLPFDLWNTHNFGIIEWRQGLSQEQSIKYLMTPVFVDVKHGDIVVEHEGGSSVPFFSEKQLIGLRVSCVRDEVAQVKIHINRIGNLIAEKMRNIDTYFHAIGQGNNISKLSESGPTIYTLEAALEQLKKGTE